jgi:3-oxoadipate enol-lactonase
MEQVIVNNITLAFDRRGSGTPLVLLHGYPLDHRIWLEVAPILKDRFDLILPDLRGFGGSSTVSNPYTLNDMASDIASLLDRLGVEKPAIAGHSMGGYVALAFARLYPGRVRGLGLVSSQAAADTPERREGRYKSAAEVAEKGVGIVTEAMSAKLSEDPRVRTFVHEMIEDQSPQALIGALKAMAGREDATPLLSSFNFPVTVIHGTADQLIPVERAREIRNILPEARLFELEGVGHMPMVEASSQTAEGLRVLV